MEIIFFLIKKGLFATYPQKHVSIVGGLIDQTVGTCVLIIVVLAINDRRNVEIPLGTSAILVGLTGNKKKYIYF